MNTDEHRFYRLRTKYIKTAYHRVRDTLINSSFPISVFIRGFRRLMPTAAP